MSTEQTSVSVVQNRLPLVYFCTDIKLAILVLKGYLGIATKILSKESYLQGAGTELGIFIPVFSYPSSLDIAC